MRRFGSITVALLLGAAMLSVVALSLPADAQLPPPGSAQTWFFAEGNTLPNWFEFITVINPDPNNDITVDVEYQLEEPAGFPAGTRTRQLPVAAGQRATLSVYEDLGRAQGAGLGQPGVYTGVSARLTSSGNFVAERPMYFINNFDVGEVNGTHDALGVNAASTTWYFAEGSTLQEPAPGGGAVTPAAGQLRGFMPFFTMQNVSGADANVTITYQTNNPDTVLEKTIPVPNNARITTDIANAFDNPAYPGSLGAGFEGFGTSIASDQPIIVERPFYTNREFPGIGFVNAASDERGALTANTTTRLFAEGTVLDGFFEFITVFNPNNSDTNLELQYQIEGQTSPEVRTLFVPALARRTVQVYNENSEGGLGRAIPQASAPSSAGVSVRIVSTNGVGFVAERPMYFIRDFGNGPVNGAHDVLGAGVPDTSWFFAEGTLRNGFFEFISIQNPNPTPTTARLDYFINGQPIATNTRDLPANSRVTVTAFDPNSQGSLAQVLGGPVPADVDFGLRVTSVDGTGRPDPANQIVVERPMYVNAVIAGTPPAINGGHNTLGFQFPAGEVPTLPGQPPEPEPSPSPSPTPSPTPSPSPTPPTADLSIAKAGPATVPIGETIRYEITATNTGPADATGVSISDSLPGATATLSSSTNLLCAVGPDDVLDCDATGPVAAGAVLTVTVTVAVQGVAPCGSITNVASVSGAAPDDPDPADDRAAVTSRVTPCADLAVTKSADPDPAVRGGVLTYTVVVTNNGPTTAEDVVLTDTISWLEEDFDDVAPPALPAGWTTDASGAGTTWETTSTVSHTPPNSAFVAEPGAPSDHRLVSPPFTVGPNGVVSFQHQWDFEISGGFTCSGGILEISINGGPFTDISATGGSFIEGGYNGTVECALNPLLGLPAWVGSSSGMTPTVVSLPPAAADQSVQLRWRMGSDISSAAPGWNVDTISVTGTPQVFDLGDIGPGASVVTVITTTVGPDEDGPITNTATALGSTFDADLDDNTATITTEVVAGADLRVSKSASSPTTDAGEQVTYTVTVTNDGPDPAGETVLTDTLEGEAGFSFDPSECDGGASLTGPSQLECTFTDIPAGESRVLTAEVTAGTSTITNTAVADGATADPNLANNTAQVTTTVNPSADLEVTQATSTIPATPTEPSTTTITVTITNLGPDTATDTELTGTVMFDPQAYSVTTDGNAGTAVGGTCPDPALEPENQPPLPADGFVWRCHDIVFPPDTFLSYVIEITGLDPVTTVDSHAEAFDEDVFDPVLANNMSDVSFTTPSPP